MDFDVYVAEHRQSLFRFAVVLSGDPALADDVVAEALLRAYERWPHIGTVEHVHAYVRRIVLNEYLGWRRRASRLVLRPDAADDRSTPDHADAHAEHLLLVHELRQLPPKQRAAVVLRYYEGLPFAAIAALLGTGENAVRSNVSRALSKLRVQLDDDAEPDPAITRRTEEVPR